MDPRRQYQAGGLPWCHQGIEHLEVELDALRRHDEGDEPGTVPLERGPDGGHVVLEDGKLSGVSTGDTEAFAGYRNMLDRFAAALEPFWLKTIKRSPSLQTNYQSTLLW